MSFFSGPWRIIPERGFSDLKKRLEPGEIIHHSSGNFILCCPFCNALQFSVNKNTGTTDKPNFDKPVLCGAGQCKKCAKVFSVQDGETVMAELDYSVKIKLPDILIDAGVNQT